MHRESSLRFISQSESTIEFFAVSDDQEGSHLFWFSGKYFKFEPEIIKNYAKFDVGVF